MGTTSLLRSFPILNVTLTWKRDKYYLFFDAIVNTSKQSKNSTPYYMKLRRAQNLRGKNYHVKINADF